MKIDLSIIIVTYNGLEITLKTLDSYRKALQADKHYAYEIIVVDNASPDGVSETIAKHYPEINLIRNSENVGFSRANNIGFTASSGRYVLFSNPDIEVMADTLPTLINLMDEQAGVGACTPFLKLVKTGQIDWGAHRGFPTPWAAFTYFSRLSTIGQKSKQLAKIFGQYHLLACDLSRPHEVDVIRGGFCFVRRAVFEAAGRWDERYFMFGEDIDLCYQIKNLGYKIIFYPHVVALHYHGLTTGLKVHSRGLTTIDNDAQRRTYSAFYEAMKLFYDKNYQTKYSRLIRWLIFLGIDIKLYLGRYRRTV